MTGIFSFLAHPSFPIFESSLKLTSALDEVRQANTAQIEFPGTIKLTVGEQVSPLCWTEIMNALFTNVSSGSSTVFDAQ